MKKTSKYILTIVGLACAATAFAAQPAQDATEQPTTSAPTPQQKDEQSSKPMVRVSNRPAKDTRDGRVRVGGVMISAPSFAPPTGNQAPDAAKMAEDLKANPPDRDASLPDGLIEVPMNTIGPGLSLQQRNDMNAAEREVLRAQARAASRVADAPLASERNGAPAIYLNGLPWAGFGSFGNIFSPGYFGTAPGGPVTTTTYYSDTSAAGQAQRNFAAAAAAGTGVLGNQQQQSNERVYQNTIPPKPRQAGSPVNTDKK